jgi:hypothetical protein
MYVREHIKGISCFCPFNFNINNSYNENIDGSVRLTH